MKRSLKIYLIAVGIFFCSIFLYSFGIFDFLLSFFLPQKPLAAYSGNLIFLNQTLCSGKIAIKDASCKNGIIELTLKNEGNSEIENSFIIVLTSSNSVAYHGFAQPKNLKPGEEELISFPIELKKIFKIEVISTRCSNLKTFIYKNLSC